MGGFPIFFKLSTVPLSSDSDECSFSILTTIASPRIEAISKIKEGEALKVHFNEADNVIEVLSEQDEVCGAIISSVNRLKKCIAKNVLFEARVIARDGAECQVVIRNKA